MARFLSTVRAAQIVAGWTLTGDPLDHWRRLQEKSRFFKPAPPNRTHALTDEAVTLILARLRGLGYLVTETSHKSPYDLLVDDVLLVEVKAANWTERAARPGHGRYKAMIKKRQFKTADLYIFAVKNGVWRYFIIPARAVTSLTLEITSYDPARYTGKYAPYLESWDVIGEALRARPRQLTFGEVA